MHTPKISIILPVYNVEKYLYDSLCSIQRQKFKDFEVICVDDGSTDNSVEILKKFSRKDSRFYLLSQENAGAGAARNNGFLHAKGDYTIFLDSDDLFSPLLLSKLYEAAINNDADIATCNFSRFDASGNISLRKGVHPEWLPKGVTVFNYKDCPHHILSVVNPTPWNKLYKSDFIRKHNLKYEEISSSNDITFAAVSVASAEKIVYIPDSLVQYRIGHAGTTTSTKTKNLNNVAIAVSSAVRQAKALPYSDVIMDSILRFCVDNYLFALRQYIIDFNSPMAKEFYTYVHETFNGSDFAEITPESLHNQNLYRAFFVIGKHNYETMRKLVSRKLIVSLTTYPGRIETLSQVLDTIYCQTHPADEIVLWLTSEQFPNKEQDLPEDLVNLVQENRLTVRWCADLKPHKKYFYALQEYSNDIVVTVDDDLLYPKDMLDKLYKSYMRHPNAVSTMRAHLIVITEQNRILPYNQWLMETDACLYEPSMQLLATGGAGTLYPPNHYRTEFFDMDAIQENCLWADDLWLKAMEVVSDIPVVVASTSQRLCYLPGSQVEALCHSNVNENMNDVQLAKIIEWLDNTFEKGIFIRKMTATNIGVNLLGIESLCAHFDIERKNLKNELHRVRSSKNVSIVSTNAKKQYRSKVIKGIAQILSAILGGLQCWDDHGFVYTIKYAFQKIVKRNH